jgi:hypothetical protein
MVTYDGARVGSLPMPAAELRRTDRAAQRVDALRNCVTTRTAKAYAQLDSRALPRKRHAAARLSIIPSSITNYIRRASMSIWMSKARV